MVFPMTSWRRRLLSRHLWEMEQKEFAVVFGAMGVKHDVADFFQKTFEESGVSDHVCMFLNLANDPVVERLITTEGCADRCGIPCIWKKYAHSGYSYRYDFLCRSDA